MLLEFSVQNFRSVLTKQTISLVSSSADELASTNTFLADNEKLRLVRSAVMYGPNASGKTNFVRALLTMRRIILDSSRRQQGEPVGVVPYLLDVHSSDQPSEFVVKFIAQGVRYEYGFSATNERIIEEWLFAYPKGRPQKWIDRAYRADLLSYDWGKTDRLSGSKQLWQDVTRSNALFLSTAVQLNSVQLRPVYDWFRSQLRVVVGSLSETFTIKQYHDNVERNAILDLLRKADFNIADIEVEVETIKIDGSTDGSGPRPQGRRYELARSQELNELTTLELKMFHDSRDGRRVPLSLDDESDGTQKFFAFASPLLDVLRHGYVLFVDELSNSLHPTLVRFLIQMFHDSNVNTKNAQIVFTTHETSILSSTIFRRDQVWFTEKDEIGATILYPLSDFSPRKNENLEKHYLQGRFGGIPILESGPFWGGDE